MRKSSLVLLTLILSMLIPIHFVKADSWVLVAKFEGSGSTQTELFTCDYSEFRIRWKFTPSIHSVVMSDFVKFDVTLFTYDSMSRPSIVHQIETIKPVKEGVSIIKNSSGNFYMSIMTYFVDEYTIIVEQNTDSIPESEENWVEVTTLTGGGGIGSTKTFTVEHVDWRILWEIEPGNGTERKSFLVYIYSATGGQWFESIQHFGVEETTGILNIYNYSGSFYMNVLASIDSYKMIIEQNIDSIPEFPSWTLLPLFLIVTFIAILIGRKVKSKNKINNFSL